MYVPLYRLRKNPRVYVLTITMPCFIARQYSGLRPAPLPPAQPLSLSTTGLNVSHVQNSNLFLKWGGGEQISTLGKKGAWGDATCTYPWTCVPRPCSSLCMVTPVLALQVWLSTCSMVSGREESSMCRLHS